MLQGRRQYVKFKTSEEAGCQALPFATLLRDMVPATRLEHRQRAKAPGGIERQDFIDGMRGLASLYVVLHHVWLQVWPVGHFPTGLIMASTGWLMWGHFAVSIFIVVSGYCLTLPVARRGRRDFSAVLFLKRRARRILPPYYLSFLFTGVLVYAYIGHKTGTHWDAALPPTLARISHGLLLVPEFGTINHVYWSIGVECKIYLLFPLLLMLFGWFGVLRSVAVTTVLTFCVSYAIRGNLWSALSPHYIGLFCFGAAAAYIVNSPELFWNRVRGSRLWEVCLIGAFLTTTFLLRVWGFMEYRFFAVDLFVGLGGTALLIICGRSPSNPMRHVLSWRPLVFVGTFSYSLYLIHAPLLQVAWQSIISGLFQGQVSRFLALLVLGVPFVLVCAWGFYRVCEKPFVPKGGPLLRPATSRTP